MIIVHARPDSSYKFLKSALIQQKPFMWLLSYRQEFIQQYLLKEQKYKQGLVEIDCVEQ